MIPHGVPFGCTRSLLHSRSRVGRYVYRLFEARNGQTITETLLFGGSLRCDRGKIGRPGTVWAPRWAIVADNRLATERSTVALAPPIPLPNEPSQRAGHHRREQSVPCHAVITGTQLPAVATASDISIATGHGAPPPTRVLA